MSEVTAALPRKNLSPNQREFLKKANRALLDKPNGRIGSAAFMDIVADWHGFRGALDFGDYAVRWVAEGNAKNKIADQLLRELFGLNEPDPRKAA
jgi:hypothetical protein